MSKKKHYLFILVCCFMSLSFVYWHTSNGLNSELNSYLASSTKVTETTSSQIEFTFNKMYTSLRTIARLPGIRSRCFNKHTAEENTQEHSNDMHVMNRDGSVIEESTRLTIQEIYNSLYTNVSVSEIYIIPSNLDPDGLDPTHNSPTEPTVTFDELIINKNASTLNSIDEDDVEIEEIEIFEYRLMRAQLDWFQAHYPNHALINGLEYPMIGGTEVLTCDNTFYNPAQPNNKDRSGMVFSVPYYNVDGVFSGSIACVILSKQLSNLLHTGDYGIINTKYKYQLGAPISGQWQQSVTKGFGERVDNSLLYSEFHPISTHDHLSSWNLWAGHSDEMFWSRVGVQSVLKTRYLGYLGVSLFTIILLLGLHLLLKSQRQLKKLNTSLESTVKHRTSALLDSRNSAVSALGREKEVANELRSQQYSLDQHAIVSVTDTTGKIIYANEKFCKISGYTRKELLGSNHRILKSGEHSLEFYKEMWKTISSGKVYTGEVKNKSKDGSFYWVRVTIVPFKNSSGKIIKYSAIRTEITKSKEIELHLLENNKQLSNTLEREKNTAVKLGRAMVKLEALATTDKLTGLSNRSIFFDRLELAMKRSNRQENKFAVLFFDFDRFKLINDSLGHEAGDLLLCHIADIFRCEVRNSDTVARFGGDEFLVLLDNLTDWPDAHKKAKKLLESFSQIHDIDGHQILSTASIGLVTSKHHYSIPSEMVRDADVAMYEAKSKGKAQIVEFDEAMHAKAVKRLSLESDLSNALEQEQFTLMYQPIVNLNTLKLIGFEALVRWHHPSLGLINPYTFIPIAEDIGSIIPIGRWVLQTAASQINKWNKGCSPENLLKISVNVSKRQLMNQSFFIDLLDCQKSYGLHNGELLLEVTESTIIENIESVIPLLNKIHDSGFQLAIDDFGTGVSSLSALHKFPIDVLKIDQSFIRAVDKDDSLLEIVSSISSLATHLGIKTVAEGIENAKVAKALREVGCEFGQGYYYAKPLSSENAEQYIRSSQKKISAKQQKPKQRKVKRAA